MRLHYTTLIAATGFGIVWIAAMASCNEDDPNNLLTTNATDMMATVGGSGGTSTDGGGGAGADGGTSQGGAGATGGQGGQGGEPEPMIHGCLSTTAADLTAAANPVAITYPGTGLCFKVAEGAMIDFATDAPATRRIVVGDFENNVKSPFIQTSCTMDVSSCPNWTVCVPPSCTSNPHYCPTSPYVCADPGPTGPLLKSQAELQIDGYGVFPFYDDKNPDTVKGVIYVQ